MVEPQSIKLVRNCNTENSTWTAISQVVLHLRESLCAKDYGRVSAAGARQGWEQEITQLQ